MRGIEKLIAMRQARKRPDTVLIDFDERYLPPKYSIDYRNLMLGYQKTKDYRPFYRLDVILISESWKDEIPEVFEGLKPYAKRISVLVADFAPDFGWYWTKETGEVEYGKRI